MPNGICGIPYTVEGFPSAALSRSKIPADAEFIGLAGWAGMMQGLGDIRNMRAVDIKKRRRRNLFFI
jgi:hypothetical protein